MIAATNLLAAMRNLTKAIEDGKPESARVVFCPPGQEALYREWFPGVKVITNRLMPKR